MAKGKKQVSAQNYRRQLRTKDYCYQASLKPGIVLTSRAAPMMVNGSMPNTLDFLLNKQRQKCGTLEKCDKIGYNLIMKRDWSGYLSDLPQPDALAELKKRCALVLREVQTCP